MLVCRLDCCRVLSPLVDDLLELLPADTLEEEKEEFRTVGTSLLGMARRRLDREDGETDPLVWWPQQKDLSLLFPLAKMLFAIPASSADNERSFSSASFTLDYRRTRLELAAFRAEHRIRRFIVSGTDAHSHSGRQRRTAQVGRLLARFAELVAEEEKDKEEKGL